MEPRKIVLVGLDRTPFIFGVGGIIAEYRYSASFIVLGTDKVIEFVVTKEEFNRLQYNFDNAFDLNFFVDFDFNKSKKETSGTSATKESILIIDKNDTGDGKQKEVDNETRDISEKKDEESLPF